MRSNGLLKWLLIPLALVVAFLLIKGCSGKPTPPAPLTDQTDAGRLSRAEAKALGVDGDTPRDTVATLVAQVKQLRSELKGALEDSTRREKENERLRGREADVDQRIQRAIAAEQDRSRTDREHAAGEQQQTQNLLHDMQHRLDELSAKGEHPDLPIGLGLDNEGADDLFYTEHLHWVEPQGLPPLPHAGKGAAKDAASTHRGSSPESTSNTSNDFVPESLGTPAELPHPHSLAASAQPVYTLPTNATLIGSTAMTALIGRVPIDGTVNDPYPFKVLIGADNLTANGIELPDVQGAVIGGTASGDWTLSCVRGQIRSITFVFQDGTIRTVSASASANAEGADAFRSGLGWISDPYGIPCVSGARRSNAEQYLGSQMLITAAGAGAASLVDSRSANIAYLSSGANGSNALGTVGITGNEAMGRILAGGVQEMSQWVNKLYGQAFAAIYVPPGAPVAVHLEQPIEIDYESHGRKVKATTGEMHAPLLD